MKSFDTAVAHVEMKSSNAGVKVFDASHVKTAALKRKILNPSRLRLTIAFLDGFFKSKSIQIFIDYTL